MKQLSVADRIIIITFTTKLTKGTEMKNTEIKEVFYVLFGRMRQLG